MEPTSTAAIALATIFFSKAAGKAAEKIWRKFGTVSFRPGRKFN